MITACKSHDSEVKQNTQCMPLIYVLVTVVVILVWSSTVAVVG